jgi:putative membrane protein
MAMSLSLVASPQGRNLRGFHPISREIRKGCFLIKDKGTFMKPIKQTFTAFLTALAIGGGLAGCANHHTGASASGSASISGSDGTVGAGEASFARQACQAGVTQAEIGKLAAVNTKNETVRSFAKALVKEHTQWEKELGQIFSQKGISAESELGEQFQSSINDLAELKGGAFDRAFKQQVIEDHQQAIAVFAKQAEQGTDPDLKAFAQKHLPHLREHLEVAKMLPISTDTEGPPVNSVNTVLQNPAGRTLVRP